jgi:hypothetical protein
MFVTSAVLTLSARASPAQMSGESRSPVEVADTDRLTREKAGGIREVERVGIAARCSSCTRATRASRSRRRHRSASGHRPAFARSASARSRRSLGGGGNGLRRGATHLRSSRRSQHSITNGLADVGMWPRDHGSVWTTEEARRRWKLFESQRDRRTHFRRAPGWHPACDE